MKPFLDLRHLDASAGHETSLVKQFLVILTRCIEIDVINNSILDLFDTSVDAAVDTLVMTNEPDRFVENSSMGISWIFHGLFNAYKNRSGSRLDFEQNWKNSNKICMDEFSWTVQLNVQLKTRNLNFEKSPWKWFKVLDDVKFFLQKIVFNKETNSLCIYWK